MRSLPPAMLRVLGTFGMLGIAAVAACSDPVRPGAPAARARAQKVISRNCTVEPAAAAVASGSIEVTLVDDETPGFYNDNLGTVLDGTNRVNAIIGANTGPTYLFPTPLGAPPNIPGYVADPILYVGSRRPPDLSVAAGVLGDWLGVSPENPMPLNERWAGPDPIPATWEATTETAIIYQIDLGPDPVPLFGDFSVDNGIFVWVNGQFRFGALAPGGARLAPPEYQRVSLGRHQGVTFVQILREDHGPGTGYHIRLTAARSTAGQFRGWNCIANGEFGHLGFAVTSRDARSVEFFGIHWFDSLMYRNTWTDSFALKDSGFYAGWSKLPIPEGGRFTSKPSATYWGPQAPFNLAAVGKGTDNTIRINVTGVVPGPTPQLVWREHWDAIPGATANSAPAIAFCSGTLFVFARQADNRIYWTTSNVSAGQFSNMWGNWRAIPGLIATSEPAAVNGGGSIYVVARGADGFIWQNRLAGCSAEDWRGWTLIPGLTARSGPAISSWGSGRLDVFVQGLDGFVWTNSSDDGGSTWTGYDRVRSPDINFVVGSPPAAWARAVGQIDLVALGPLDRAWRNMRR
jgi:hypothetical protein